MRIPESTKLERAHGKWAAWWARVWGATTLTLFLLEVVLKGHS